PVAVTKYGVLLGKQTRVEGKAVNIYLGVPFAKPPVGKLRFAPPEPPEPWNNIRNAGTYPPACLQQYWGQIAHLYFTTQKYQTWLRFQEDCLYLNIYTPAHAQRKIKLPVMVWFPGGAFVIGAASTYDGSVLSAHEDVVVVSIQNRLGILGFLSTGDAHARGNWALLDQIAALRWVQENIAGFGGDPSSVTLFGQSSGAICISGLILSPLSKGLFHGAISQSGTALLKLFISYDPLKIAKRIAKAAKCETNSSQVLVQCLRSKTEAEIQKVSNKMNFFRMNCTDHPEEVAGCDSQALGDLGCPSGLHARNPLPSAHLMDVSRQDNQAHFPHIMHIPIQRQIITKTKVVELLWNASALLNITKDQIPLVVKEYIGDFNFQRGKFKQLVQTARYHRDAGLPVYFYEFNHHIKAKFIIKARTDVADHGDEIGFILGTQLHNGFATEEEKKLKPSLMFDGTLSFSRNPNSHGLLEWPRYENEEKYLLLDLKQSVGTKLKEKKVAFWSRIQNHHHKQSQHGGEF
uniref:Carboxylic ester hydrolase n=1 Tax=Sarcophilus harrisii TaxID=9305 RepID=G3W685_SARHA